MKKTRIFVSGELREWLTKNKMSQREFSEFAGIKPSTMANWMTNKSRPTAPMRERLFSAIDAYEDRKKEASSPTPEVTPTPTNGKTHSPTNGKTHSPDQLVQIGLTKDAVRTITEVLELVIDEDIPVPLTRDELNVIRRAHVDILTARATHERRDLEKEIINAGIKLSN